MGETADRGGLDPHRKVLPGDRRCERVPARAPAPRRSLELLALAVAFLALGPACRGGRSAPPPERFLSAAPPFALVIPDLGRAAHELDGLYRSATAFPGAGGVVAQRQSLAAQLGFDPFDPKALAAAGIEPSRGLAVSAELRTAGSEVLLVLPVGDGPRLEEQLLRVAADRVGATVRAAETHEGQAVVVLRTAPGAPPSLSYVVSVAERTALASWGPASPLTVARAAARPAAESLAAAEDWKAARAALGERYAAIAYSARGTTLPLGGLALGHGVALGASADAGAARLAVALLAPAGPGGLRALAGQGGPAPRVQLLDPDAALALRWDGDFAELGRRLAGGMAEHDRRWLAEHGFDLQRDVFDELAPGGAAAIALNPALDLSALGELEARADPLRLVRFELVADVKDEAQAALAFARLRALAAALAEPVRRTPPPASPPPGKPGRRRAKARPPSPAADAAATAPDVPTDRIVTPSGEIAWRLTGRRLAMAGGPPGALDRLLARLDGAGPGFNASTPGAAAALAGGLGGAVLDTQRLVQRVRALPDEAFGTGPSGFLVRSVVDRVLEPAAQLAAISARADLGERALVITLTVEAARSLEPGKPGAGEPVQ